MSDQQDLGLGEPSDRSSADGERVSGRPKEASGVDEPPRSNPPKRQRARRGPRHEDPVADPGAELERRVARIEFAEGSLARTRVPVAVDAEAGRDVLTDVDVLSIDVDQRLRLSAGIFECKSGAGQSGEPDRLLWLAGFRQYLGADRSTLVRRTISARGQAIAARLHVRLIDEQSLLRFETAHAWLPATFAHVGGEQCAAAALKTTKQLKGLRAIPARLVTFLRDECWFVESWQIVGALMTLGQRVDQQGILPLPAGSVIASDALMSLFVGAIRDAGRLDYVSGERLRQELALALTVGSPTDDHLVEVLREADHVVREIGEAIHSAYQRTGAARIDVATPSLLDGVMEEPTAVLDNYVDLVERLRANAATAREMLQVVELCCFEALVGGKSHEAKAFDHLFTPEHHQLLNVAVRALGAVAGEGLTSYLAPLTSVVLFNRRAPQLPDRHQPVD